MLLLPLLLVLLLQLRCLATDSSGSFLFAGDDSGVLTAWQLSGAVLQQGATAVGAGAPTAAAETLQHKLSPLICSWQAHDSSICRVYVHRSLLISAGRDGSLKAFQLADVLSPLSGAKDAPFYSSGVFAPTDRSSSSSPRPFRRWEGHTEGISCCAFLAGPSLHRAAAPWLVVTAAADRTLKVFSPHCDGCIEAFRLPSEPLCLSLDCSGPTALAFVGCTDTNTYILKIAAAAGCSTGGKGRKGAAGTGDALLREAWVCPPHCFSSSNNNSSSSSRAAVLQGHRAAVRGCVSLGDGRFITSAADGLRLWKVSSIAAVTHIPPRPGLALPLENLQLLLQHYPSSRLLPSLGLLRQHTSTSGETAVATAVCLLQPQVEHQQQQQAVLLQREVAAADGDNLSVFRSDPRRFKRHSKILQVYERSSSKETPHCIQQLLKLSQGAAETLQEAVVHLLQQPKDAAAAAAKSPAAASVDARDVDAAELSPVSSEDERHSFSATPAAPPPAVAAAKSSSKRKVRS